MTEQDLADRLEKARKALLEAQNNQTGPLYYSWATMDSLRNDIQADLFNNLDTILASLRRSAPASGETRTAVEPEALIAKTYAQVISEGMAIYRNEGNDIGDRRAIRAFIDRFELRARTPRGETRGESTP